MARLSIVNIDNGEVVYSGITRKRKWMEVVRESREIIKGLTINVGSFVIPQGVISYSKGEQLPMYAKGSGMWLLANGGKYQIVLEQ